uniref:Uncharacterized protein n=1 Tax=Phenylobacterium glaciei TaxID=2803784 RepID=A0A974P0P2_9CAUL|nr:hypothetical protein JKL49_14215 [Phenylobacterium glaciei]
MLVLACNRRAFQGEPQALLLEDAHDTLHPPDPGRARRLHHGAGRWLAGDPDQFGRQPRKRAGAVASPLRDVNVLRTKIPQVLLDAMADPTPCPIPPTARGSPA